MKISKRTSRVMALLMTVVMLLGIMPLSVFAAEGDVAYTKISASEIAVGDEIIIVGESNNNYYALTNDNDQITDVSVSGDILTISGSTDKLIWTVGSATGNQVDGNNKLKFTFSNDGIYMGRVSQKNTVELNTSANTKYFGHVTENDTIGNYSGNGSYYGLAYSNNQFIYVTGDSNTNRNISFYNVTESTSGDEGGQNPSTQVIEITTNNDAASATEDVSIEVGESFTLKLTNASRSEKTHAISNTDSSVASVDASNNFSIAGDGTKEITITGLKDGKTTITFTGTSSYGSTYYAVVNVTVGTSGSGGGNEEGGSTVNPSGSVVVISGSDYQASNANNTMTNIMNQIKKDYPSVHGILMGGDYSASMSSANDVVNVNNVVSGVFSGIASENRIYVQGNHDTNVNVSSSLLATTGAHDTDYYGVYSINYSDFGSAASGLESYLNAKVQEGYNKPIFVISHQPLHKNSRGDNNSAVNLFKPMNEAGENGLTIIYLFGHNHSGGYDAYLGNGSIYLPKGASMDVAGGANNQKLNFTYMNCGYVGYVNGNSSTTLTMTAFEITDTEVTVKRYSVDGAVNLKAAGVGGNGYTANSTVYTSPQTVALDGSVIPPVTPDEPDVSNDGYTKVDNLANGEYVIVVGENRGLTNQTGATVSGSNSYAGLKSNKVIISEDKITDGVTEGMIWTITVNNGKITIQNENSKYLTADYGSGNTGNTRKLLLADTADANWVYTEGKLNNTSQNASQTGDYSGCYLYQTDNTTDYTISVRSLKNASNVTFYKVNRVSSEEHEHTYGAITYTGDGKTSYVAVRECTCGDKQTTTAEISYAVTIPASCTAAGVGTYTAKFAEEWAQDKDITEAIAQLGHNYGELIAKVDPIHTATELKAGKEAHYVCSACEKFFNAEKVETTEAELVIAAPTHTYGTAWESDATNHWHECECGAKSGVAVHTPGEAATETTAQKCTVCQYVITPATGHITHIYSVFVSETPATCTQTGSKVMKCTGCELTETTTLEINSSNHTYGDLVEKVDVVHTATELKAGKEAHYKCDCGKFFTDAKVETTEDELVIAAPVHSFAEFVSETPATCTQTGSKVMKCTGCDKTETTTLEIDSSNHTYGELIEKVDAVHTATELKAGKEAHYDCACGKFFTEAKVETTEDELVIPAPTHSFEAWKNNEEQHWHECECGATDTAANHDFTNGDCVCGKVAPAEDIEEIYTKVDNLINGQYVIVVGDDSALGTTAKTVGSTNNSNAYAGFVPEEVTISGNKIIDGVEDDMIWTVTVNGGKISIKNDKENKYLAADYGSQNYGNTRKLTLETTADSNWKYENSLLSNTAENSGDCYLTLYTDGTIIIRSTYSATPEAVTFYLVGEHKHDAEKVDEVEATCEETGMEAHWFCEGCGSYFTDEECKNETSADDLVIAKLPHTEETIPGTAATCTEPGLTDGKKCSVCDEILVLQNSIPALGHDYEDGECTVCGEEEPQFSKVEELISGEQYVIVVGDDSALGTTTKTAGSTNGSNAYVGFAPKEVTISGNKIIDGVEDDMIWTVTVNGGKISIKNDKENKYLAADYGSQNYGNTRKLTLETTADSNWKYEDSLLSNTAENSGNCYLTLYTDGTIIIRSDSSATPEIVTFYKVGTGTVDPEQTVLTDIEVTSNPNKMTYVAGEDFDATGMVITAIYSNGSEKVVTDYTVSGGEDMTAGQKTITITFAEGGIEKTVTLTVTVNTEAPSNPGDTVYVAFSSDVHNSGSATNSGTSAYRLNTWLNNVSTKIGATFENMAFCGDNGSANTYDSNTYWNYVQEAMNVVANSNKVEGEGIFIAGNHEYQNGSFGSTSNATAAKIKTIGYTENTSDYAIYVFGAASGSQSFNTSDINNLSTWLKNNANGDKPVFVVSHYPIHYFNSRTTDNAQALVSVLNEYPNVVFLWGHNHTLSDSHYDKVHAAGSQLQLTSSSSSKVEINFTYAAAGCMSGSEYNAASESIIGKGLVAKITDGKLVSLTYYKADGSVVSTYNHDGSNTPDIPDTPELGDKIVIISNGHVLTTAKGTDYTNTGSSSSQKYNYSGLAGEPYVEGMEYTEDMLWVMEDAGNGYFYLKNGNQYLNGSYVSNSTGGYDGSLSLGEKNDKWIWQDGMLKSYNASQGHDTGDKFLTHGNTSGGNPDVNTFTVRSGDNVNGSTEFEEAAPTEPTEHEHTWGNVVYTFAADGLTCTAQRVCSTNASHVETATATITSEVKTPATCTIMGTTTYTATFTEEWAKTRTKEVQDIPVLGHEWSDAEYTFAADGLTCSAQRVCANDESHVDTAEAVITSEVKIAATCEEKGTTTYTATFEEEWAEVQTKDVQDIAALEHKWGSAEYTFAADGSICVAKRVCENDPSHVQNAVAVITSEVKTPASCMEMGTTTYTATFTETWAGTQIKDIQNIPAIGSHSYKDGVCEVCGEIELKWQLGDVDHDGDVDNSDVEYLLWYTLFPEDYPTEDFVDFDHSGEVDNKDVEYLLWYTLFPEDYPLTAERNN